MGRPSLLAGTMRLLEATSIATGEEFYCLLARGVAECLGVKYGMVGHHIAEDPTKMRLRAVWGEGRFLPSFDYELAGTPCENVVEVGVCHFPSGASRLFPKDAMLVEMGIDSYLGMRVVAPGGRSGGIILALHDAPTEDLPPDQETVLALLARRVSSEFEREHAELELKRSEARYRRIVDTCFEGVWGIDAGGHTTFVNAQMASMLGYSADEMMGRHLYEFMDTQGREISATNIERRRSGISEQHEFKLQHRDGSDVWTIMSTNPVTDDQGGYAGAMALVTDLTERRELEARVLQAQKLESLGVLAGGIAHDFNNILVGILGNVGLALLETPDASPIAPILTDMQDAAQRLADLTRQMLAYSGKGRFVVERVDVNALISETTQLLSSVISKKASLSVDLANDAVAIDGDVTQIRQVVMNLITNASDALEERAGAITLATQVVNADAGVLRSTLLGEPLPAGEYVSIVVHDDGIGMSASTLERIFDPFFTTKFTGRGLGLAAVLGILRGHRGAVRVESEPGQGSRFEVLLPRSKSEAPRTMARIDRAPRSLRGRGVVLVADDEPHVRKIAQRLLESSGFEVLLAADGHEAVELVRREGARVSLLLLDMTMPGLDGGEVYERVRALRPELRVVLSSGYDEEQTTSRFERGALAGFLQKPWGPTELFQVVEAALDARGGD